MPCRCDGMEVQVSVSTLTDLEDKVAELETQLCNARSLIHKLMRHVDGLEELLATESVTHAVLDGGLRKRAEKHIKALLHHKREEHAADLAKADAAADLLSKQLAELDRVAVEMKSRHSMETKHVAGRRVELDAEHKKLRDARENPLSDEELLG